MRSEPRGPWLERIGCLRGLPLPYPRLLPDSCSANGEIPLPDLTCYHDSLRGYVLDTCFERVEVPPTPPPVDTTSVSRMHTSRALIRPNPFVDLVTITRPDVRALVVLDLMGRRVGAVRVKNGTADLGHLRSGTYLIRLGHRVERVVKQ